MIPFITQAANAFVYEEIMSFVSVKDTLKLLEINKETLSHVLIHFIFDKNIRLSSKRLLCINQERDQYSSQEFWIPLMIFATASNHFALIEFIIYKHYEKYGDIKIDYRNCKFVHFCIDYATYINNKKAIYHFIRLEHDLHKVAIESSLFFDNVSVFRTLYKWGIRRLRFRIPQSTILEFGGYKTTLLAYNMGYKFEGDIDRILKNKITEDWLFYSGSANILYRYAHRSANYISFMSLLKRILEDCANGGVIWCEDNTRLANNVLNEDDTPISFLMKKEEKTSYYDAIYHYYDTRLDSRYQVE